MPYLLRGFWRNEVDQILSTSWDPSVLQCSGSSTNGISGSNLIDTSSSQTGWSCIGCSLALSSDRSYTQATGRTAPYQGPSWDLTNRLSIGQPVTVQVYAQLSSGSSAVKLTARKTSGSSTSYVPVAQGQASAGCWTQISGTYTLDGPADQIVVYLEGAPGGIDEYVKSPAAFAQGSLRGSTGSALNVVRFVVKS